MPVRVLDLFVEFSGQRRYSPPTGEGYGALLLRITRTRHCGKDVDATTGYAGREPPRTSRTRCWRIASPMQTHSPAIPRDALRGLTSRCCFSRPLHGCVAEWRAGDSAGCQEFERLRELGSNQGTVGAVNEYMVFEPVGRVIDQHPTRARSSALPGTTTSLPTLADRRCLWQEDANGMPKWPMRCSARQMTGLTEGGFAGWRMQDTIMPGSAATARELADVPGTGSVAVPTRPG